METRRTGTGISQLRYLHKDILGSVTAVSDDYGRVSTELEYSPFGELISGSAGSLGNFGFTGQEWDNDITMYHFPARYYEPLWGRFMTRDPYTNLPDDARSLNDQPYDIRTPYFYKAIGKPSLISLTPIDPSQQLYLNTNTSSFCPLIRNPQFLNKYLYVENNPVNYVDVFGFLSKSLALCAIVADCLKQWCEKDYDKGNSAFGKEKDHDADCLRQSEEWFKECIKQIRRGFDPPPIPRLECEGYIEQFNLN